MSAIASGRRLSQVFVRWRMAGEHQRLVDRGLPPVIGLTWG